MDRSAASLNSLLPFWYLTFVSDAHDLGLIDCAHQSILPQWRVMGASFKQLRWHRLSQRPNWLTDWDKRDDTILVLAKTRLHNGLTCDTAGPVSQRQVSPILLPSTAFFRCHYCSLVGTHLVAVVVCVCMRLHTHRGQQRTTSPNNSPT